MGCCCSKSPDAISGQNPSKHDARKGKENKHSGANQASITRTSGQSSTDLIKSQKSVPEFKSLCDTVPSAQQQDQEPVRLTSVQKRRSRSHEPSDGPQGQEPVRHQDVRLKQEQSGNDAQHGKKDKRHHPDQTHQTVRIGLEQSRNDVHHGQKHNHHPDQVRHGEEIKQLNDNIQELSRNLEDHQKREINLRQKNDELSSRNIALEKERGELRIRNIALQNEIEELLIRLSSLISAKLMDGNPEITDLSDPNRPTKIAEMYSELYDNAWTDAFDVLSKLESEETAIRILLDILLISYKASSNSVKEKWNNFNQKMESSKMDENTSELKRKEKNNLKKNFKSGQESIRQPILDEIQKQVKLPAESDKDSMVMEYIDQVAKITWLMAVQDPMVYMENKIVRGNSWDKNKYKEYTKRGDTIDFVVWPPLLLHEGGPLLMKGVAQGKQHNRTPAEDGKTIGGATHVEETGAATIESCNDKGIAAKTGNDPELSPNRTAGDVGIAGYQLVKNVDLSKMEPGDVTKLIDKDRDKETADESHGGKVNVEQRYKTAERQGKGVVLQASISQRTSATSKMPSLQSVPKKDADKKSDESIKTNYPFNKNSSEVNSNTVLCTSEIASPSPIKTADAIDKEPATEPAIKDQGKKKTEDPSSGKVKSEDGLVQTNDQHGDMTADSRRKSEVPQATTHQQISTKDSKKKTMKSATENRNKVDNLKLKFTASGSVNQGLSKVADNEKQKPTNRTVISVGSASQMNAKAFERNTTV